MSVEVILQVKNLWCLEKQLSRWRMRWHVGDGLGGGDVISLVEFQDGTVFGEH